MSFIIHSMTGFGRYTAEKDGRKMSIELKSVNHRNLDLGIRLFRSVSFLEEFIRSTLSAKLERGHVDVYLHYLNERDDQKVVAADMPLARAYVDTLQSLSKTLKVGGKITVAMLAGLPDVMRITEREENEDALRSLAEEALIGAVEELVAMRRREGERLKADILGRLDAMERLVGRVEERSPQMVVEYRDRLRTRIAELCEDVKVDETRLAAEVAFFADRASIAEETVRLNCHIGQMRTLLDAEEPVGRKMDFLVQEMNREVNTICSKANDIDITNAGLSLKSEIEKIREQVQNIE